MNYIVHYHIYKNAGSTIIEILQANFGKLFTIELDKHALYATDEYINLDTIRKALRKDKRLVAFSAHKLTSNVHLFSKNKTVFYPILIIRHPLLRAASAYRYESKFPEKNKEEYERANNLDFNDWLIWQMGRVDSITCRNYQTHVLGIPGHDILNEDGEFLKFPPRFEYIKPRLDKISFIGLVEYLPISLKIFQAEIREIFPNFMCDFLRANATKTVENWNDELTDLENSLNKDTLESFHKMNKEDYTLFWYAKNRLDIRLALNS